MQLTEHGDTVHASLVADPVVAIEQLHTRHLSMDTQVQIVQGHRTLFRFH
jgi:hypothetical protein